VFTFWSHRLENRLIDESIENKILMRLCCNGVVLVRLTRRGPTPKKFRKTTKILAAVRPTLMTTRGPLLMASELYDAFKKYYGVNGPPDILVAYGTSRDLNPSLPQSGIDRELERDPVRNRAEYLSEWRSDVERFIPREIVEACVGDFYELPPQPGENYHCFFDPASGVPEGDSLAAVVSHKLGDRVIIDAVREIKPPFNFFEVIETVLLPLCKAYKIFKVVGDNYGGELAKEPVRRVGIDYELSAKHTSQLYLDPFLGMLNATKIALPRHERAISQICQLERSVQRSGRDQITHPTHGHDDVACAIAGAVDLACNASSYSLDAFQPGFVDRDAPPPLDFEGITLPLRTNVRFTPSEGITQFVPSREARVYDNGVGPGLFLGVLLRYDSPTMACGKQIVGALRQSRRFLSQFPGGFAVMTHRNKSLS